MNSFTHAGVSKLNGKFKVRYANDAVRVKVLAKNGHTDIDLIELKTPMDKEDALAYLMSIDFANGNTEIQAALEAEIDKRSVPAKAASKDKPKKEAKKPKKEAVPAKKVAAKAVAKPAAKKEKAPTAAEQATAIAAAKAAIAATVAEAEPAPL